MVSEIKTLKNSIVQEASLKRYVREVLLPNHFINHGRNTKLSKCIGFIGARGSMKSLSGAGMTIVDYLVPGYKVYSNMAIQWGLNIGGYSVGYATQDLDKPELLKLHVGNGMLFIDEINLEFAEARRTMTNRNLTFNRLIQQLRKKQLNLIYTVQHEMWIDNRLRWQTDIFIKCRDILLNKGGLNLPYDFGTYCDWTIYDRAGILGAGSYDETQMPVGVKRFYGKRWWDTFDTNEIQAEDEITYGKTMGEPKLTGSKNVEVQEKDWGAFHDRIQDIALSSSGEEIRADELWQLLGIKELDISTIEAGKHIEDLENIGVTKKQKQGKWFYIFNVFELKEQQ